MQKIAPITLRMIHDQIEAGLDIEGRRYRYSTRPFAMPVGAMLAFARRTLARSRQLVYFRRRGGLWAVILGGYAAYRRAAKRLDNGDYLRFSGRMLASLIYDYDDERIKIRFSNRNRATVAYYLNVTGAGRSRRLWLFLGLTPQHLARLMDLVGQELVTGTWADELVRRLRQSAS